MLMDIKISYAGRLVGVYDSEDLYVQPLFLKITRGTTQGNKALLNYLQEGNKVVFEDFDGHLIELESVVLWV
jgi:hypothetical protein